jgi:radical SAM/Cys-rich protein
VNLQRGRGVFDRSIKGLQQLNSLGYGQEGSDLVLDLVYNPGGAFLPPDQASLEEQYKEILRQDFDIRFNSLLTLTNMPIKRFADMLYKSGRLQEYMELLVQSFNPAATKGVMCRDTLSVAWDGKLYDCDFNQQLQMSLGESLEEIGDAADADYTTGTSPQVDSQGQAKSTSGSGLTVFDIKSTEELMQHRITIDSHCFGCTAGAGSSCQGTTV